MDDTQHACVFDCSKAPENQLQAQGGDLCFITLVINVGHNPRDEKCRENVGCDCGNFFVECKSEAAAGDAVVEIGMGYEQKGDEENVFWSVEFFVSQGAVEREKVCSADPEQVRVSQQPTQDDACAPEEAVASSVGED